MTVQSPHSVPLQAGTIVQLVKDLSQISSHVQLRHLEWGLLLAVTGQHTLAQIGDHFELQPQVRQEIFERLRQLGLVEERPVSFNEYVRARAVSGGDESATLAQFLTPGAALGAVPGEAPPSPVVSKAEPTDPQIPASTPTTSPPTPPGNKADDSATVPLVTQVISTRRPTPPVASFEPLEPPPVPSPTNDVVSKSLDKRLSLKALMRFIIDRAADLNAGQLDVYKVFIRIDSQLLKRNGITTLRFEEDHLVSDPVLEKALANSLQHTLGLPCPEEVFVAA